MSLPVGAAPAHADEEARPRPVGTALDPAGRAASGLSRISTATYPPQYLWGVETGTGVDADDLEPGRPRRVTVGGTELMLMNVEGKVCAAARTCPHRGWDLSKGPVEDGVITCTLHGAQFDASSGEVLRQPYSPEFNRTHPLLGGMMSRLDPKKSTEPLQTYPTVIADDGEVPGAYLGAAARSRVGPAVPSGACRLPPFRPGASRQAQLDPGSRKRCETAAPVAPRLDHVCQEETTPTDLPSALAPAIVRSRRFGLAWRPVDPRQLPAARSPHHRRLG